MTKVFEDMVEGGGSISITGGTVYTRVFTVSEVTGNPSAIMFNAAVTGLIPKTGDLHPDIPEIRVDTINFSPVDSRIVKVTVNYKPLEFGETDEDETVISFGGTVQSVLTNKFINGKKQELMILKYKYPAGKAPDGVDDTKEVVATVTKEIASIVASLSRRESTSALGKIAKFVGTMNSKGFLGQKAKTWLCTNIRSVSNDSGKTYQVDYEFQFNRDTWDKDVAFTDAETGLIPPDVEKQKDALKKFQLQEKADFGQLNLEKFGG